MDRDALRLRPLCAALAMLLLLAAASSPAATGDDPVPGWRERVDRAASDLGRLPSGDAAGLERLGGEVGRLRGEIAAWLGSFAPAAQGEEPWLPAAGPLTTVEDVASELGRLRAVLARISAALQGGDPGAFYLGRVEVTVTAAAETTAASAAPAGTVIITSEEIAAHDRSSLAGALALAPGVSFVRVGSRNETTVYVRGFDQRQVPLFIDGIPVYTPYDGYADMQRFTTFDMAEVRVSKSFASVLYGPNALGGAINVVTRQPARPLEGSAGVGYASGTSANLFANVGSRQGKWFFHATGAYLDADTFPLPGGFDGARNQPAGDRLNAYSQDYKFSGKVGWTPTGNGEYAVSYVMQRGEKGNPPYAGSDAQVRVRYWQWPYWDKDSVYALSQSQLGRYGYVRGRAYYDRYSNALYSYDDASYTTQNKPSSFRSLYDDHALGASVEWGATLGPQVLKAAGHGKWDSHQDHNSGDPAKEFEERILSVGVEDSIALSPRLSLVTGISGDWQATTKAMDYQKGRFIDLLEGCEEKDTCGDTSGVNPQVGLFRALSSGMARVTLSRKTRLPTLNNRYSYKFGTQVPNPGLDPEHSLVLEAGYDGAIGRRTTLQAAVFYGRIADLIQRYVLAPNLQQMRNIGEASNAGFEVDVQTRLAHGVLVGGNYSFLDRSNISDPATPLVDTPRHKAALSGTFPVLDALRVMAYVQIEADRKTQNEAGTYFDAPSFAEVSLKGVWTIRRVLDIEASVHNLFDADYWVAEGYPEPGRRGLVELRWRF